MDREVLFRIKDRISGDWCYGFPINAVDKNNVVSFVGKDEKGGEYFNALADAETLTEFTGLSDKNGKQIFEGDICTDGHKRWIIHFHFYGWQCKEIGTTWELSFPLWQWDNCKENGYRQLEVIGNIHDNPELLKA